MTLTDKQARLLADFVLWGAKCPIKLKPETFSGILTQIQLQRWHEKADKLNFPKIKEIMSQSAGRTETKRELSKV